MLKRNLYIERIRPYFNKKLIKVLTGQRRVGKTYILQLIIKELSESYPKANIIYVDKEKYEFDYIRTHSELMEYIDFHKKDEMNYLFIDEIQDITGFERVIRSLHNEDNFDIYCTGSNAKIFSGELATYLSGRQISFRISSLNFKEFCQFHNINQNRESLNKYMKFGGLPYLMHLPDDDIIRFEYLNNINSTILFRDIINRHEIRDPRFLTDLLRFIADNTGSIFSANKISAYLKNQQINKNVSKILDYLSYIENAYFINKVQKTDIQGKKHFEVGEKYYFEDVGLRNAIIGFNPQDIGKIIENLVFLHLKNSGYSITIGALGNKEIDFIATKNGEKKYIQVSYLLSDEKTIEREFGNLLKIEDNYPKYVISYDTFSAPNTYKGIIHLTLLEFLTDFE
jgi:predicted AAA+ superfamily ATPase